MCLCCARDLRRLSYELTFQRRLAPPYAEQPGVHTEGENSASCRCQIMSSEPPEMAAAPGSGPHSFPLRRSNTCISGLCSWSLGMWAHRSSSWFTGMVRALQWIPLPCWCHLSKTQTWLPTCRRPFSSSPSQVTKATLLGVVDRST